MGGSYPVVMGDRGRVVVPAEVRDRSEMRAGTPLVLFETPRGIVLSTRPQLRELVRAELAGFDLLGELLAERRQASMLEDGG